jgi:hypothetical protein
VRRAQVLMRLEMDPVGRGQGHQDQAVAGWCLPSAACETDSTLPGTYIYRIFDHLLYY